MSCKGWRRRLSGTVQRRDSLGRVHFYTMIYNRRVIVNNIFCYICTTDSQKICQTASSHELFSTVHARLYHKDTILMHIF